MRMVWLITGLLAVSLAIAGILLPLLPTVPFLLLAAFCFARSSDRLNIWLHGHPRLGPPIAAWQKNGAISIRAKRLATISLAASLVVSLLMGFDWQLVLIQICVLSAVAVFILSRPSE